MADRRRVGILTGGGDVPGLNVAIKAVVSGAHSENIDIMGIRRGWMGLLGFNPDDTEMHGKLVRLLTIDNVRTIDRTGGTILHTSRTNPSNVRPDEVFDSLDRIVAVAYGNIALDQGGHGPYR